MRGRATIHPPPIRCPLCGWWPCKEDLWSCSCGHQWNTFDTGGFRCFRNVLSTGRAWGHSYECSSPTLFRMFRMRIHLLKPQNWFVVTNALTVERSHARMAAADPNAYVDANGLITICAHCRCSKRVDSPDQCDFVPEYLQPRLESAVKVSHGLCPVCRAYFYPTQLATPPNIGGGAA